MMVHSSGVGPDRSMGSSELTFIVAHRNQPNQDTAARGGGWRSSASSMTTEEQLPEDEGPSSMHNPDHEAALDLSRSVAQSHNPKPKQEEDGAGDGNGGDDDASFSGSSGSSSGDSLPEMHCPLSSSRTMQMRHAPLRRQPSSACVGR